jgi:hypothetical protein
MTLKELEKWKNKIKMGDIVIVHPYMEARTECRFSHFLHKNKNICIVKTGTSVKQIRWADIIAIYTKDKNPEMFV